MAYILFDLVLTDTNQLFPEMSFLLEVLSLWVFIFFAFHQRAQRHQLHTRLYDVVLYCFIFYPTRYPLVIWDFLTKKNDRLRKQHTMLFLFINVVALWSSGRHLASGSGGPGFESLGKALYMHFLTPLMCKTSTRL